ncbi:TIGR00159 family protein [Staphylococcus muscae]|uniref:Diadenylate cyclase n=1 Tax=Staphylococcus muscae TaxID=1294 RepID=A0A240C6I7_9STAP|nr:MULTISPECIES: diadenylate cyclase CdaA [Staphylococcus]AVQ33564.1 TIGR00159 family protein [Staphylococcus muscae]PNZ02478.1 TIGR00159 family protein [Staphylococcus muscae]UXR77913.1 diadenylate cyclase CdaA [Staphylococcus sp. IVB6227]UXR82074.1 diadenylate cyclase CdaA [Staphylococcus sp. IVB6214]SNW03535.1 ABC transporter, permease protein YbbP clustered with maltose/maltodextrin transporter / Tlr1762 protein [Staphylococcus muscae]
MHISNLFEKLSTLEVVTGILDLLIVWYVIYLLIAVFRGTKAIQLLKGILFILIGKAVSEYLQLTTTSRMFDLAMQWGFLAIIVIFQPEIRRALEQLGRGSFFKRYTTTSYEEVPKLVDAVSKAVQYMAKRRIGALIVFEKETGLQDYIETGIPMHSDISQELLTNVFIPNTPLHDGAMIIQGDKIATAASYLPLSDSPKIAKSLGTRHRAAVGISEVSDAFTVIVSEETGSISVTFDGKLRKDISVEVFEELLSEHWFGTHFVKKGVN